MSLSPVLPPRPLVRARKIRIRLAFSGYAVLAGLAGGQGCGVGTQDQDRDRQGAKPVKTCGVVTDKLDFDGEDPLDYKLLQVPETGTLRVRVHWDNPKIESQISLQDKFGVILERKKRNDATNNDTISQTIDKGVYFVQIKTEAGASVYSLETSFNGAGGGGCGDDEEPIPVIVELQRKPKDKKKGGGGDSGGGGAVAVPPPPVAPPPIAPMQGFGGGGGGGGGSFDEPLGDGGGGTGADDIPEPPGAKVRRRGDVTRVVENRSGDTEITIALGRADGVKKGVRGRLLSPGGKPLRGGALVVVKVYSSACKAKTSYPSDQIPDGSLAELKTLK